MIKFIKVFINLYKANKSQYKLLTTTKPTVINIIRQTKKVIEAMKLYRSEHNYCEWCYRDNPEVHHIISLWKNITLASDLSNFICLCRKCHFVVGHSRNFGQTCIPNIKTLCKSKQTIFRKENGDPLKSRCLKYLSY